MAEEPGLGRTVLELATDTTHFNAGIASAEQKVAGLHGAFGTAGKGAKDLGQSLDGTASKAGFASGAMQKLGAMISFAAVSMAVRSFTELTGRLTDLSSKTGISTTELQKLGYAAKMNGVELDTLTTGVTKLGRTLVEGDKSAVKALGTLGLKLDDVRKMDPAQAFTTIGDAIAKIKNPMEQATLAMQLFGKSGADLLPAMKGNLSATAAEAERLGLVMSEETVAAGDKLGDTLDTLTLVGGAFIGKVLTPLVPYLVSAVEWFTKAGGGVDMLRYGVDALGIAFGQGIAKLYDWGAALAHVGAMIADKLPGFMTGWSAKELAALERANRESAQWWRDAADAQRRQVILESQATQQTKNHAAAVAGLLGQYKDTTAAVKDYSSWLDRMELAQHRMYEDWLLIQGGNFASGLPQGKLQYTAGGLLIPTPGNYFMEGSMDASKIAEWTERVGEGVEATEDWTQALTGLASQFARLGQVSGGGGFGGVIKDIANIVGAVEMGAAAGKTFTNTAVNATSLGGQIAGYASAAIQGTVAMLQATSSSSRGMNALGGAATGASIGMAAGPIGAGIGAGIGALIGAFRSTDKEANASLDSIRTSLIQTYGSVAKVDSVAKQLGVDLNGLWTAKGKSGLATVTAQMKALQQALERDQKLIEDINAIKPGELMSAALRVQLSSAALSTDSRAAVAQFIASQTGTLAQTVAAYVAGGGNLQGAVGQGMFSAALAGADQMRLNGMSMAEIAAALAPTIATISARTGISNSFADLLNQAADPAVSALVTSSDQIGTVAVSMTNLGLLNQETFGQLTSGLSESYRQLTAQGIQGNDALRLMQPSLQKIWEIGEQTGMVVDDATQDLMNQALENGLIGDQYRSSTDKMTASIDRLIGSIDKLIGTLAPAPGGGTNPEPAPGGKGGGDTNRYQPYHLGGLISRAHQGGVLWPGGAALARAHSGMLVGRAALRADEVPIVAQTGEGILSRGGMKTAAAWLNTMNRGEAAGTGSTSAQPVTIHHYEIKAIDSQDVKQFFERRGVRAMAEAIAVDAGHQNDYAAKVLKRLVR